MRKAFTLVELLVVVTVLPFVMVAVSGVYATFIRDIPRTTRVLQENTTVLDLLQQIRRDMDKAIGLPEPHDDEARATILLIEQPDGVIRYQLWDGQVVRTPLSGQIPEDEGQRTGDIVTSDPRSHERIWRVPDAVIAWDRWMRNDRPYAVEIHSHVKQWVSGFLREKLANSSVFFVHGLAKEGEIQ